MQSEVVFAGFGGQGVLAIGQVLALAAMEEGKNVVWLPSYGPEMRGGTAYCTVVISREPIGSPVISNPSAAVVMNRPSFDKFEPKVRGDGLIIVNSSLIDARSERKDIDKVYVPANDLAAKAGTSRAANMVMLGALVARAEIVSVEEVRAALEHKLSGKKATLAANLEAFEEGLKAARRSP